MDLRKLLDRAIRRAGKEFAFTGRLQPFWLVIAGDGRRHMLRPQYFAGAESKAIWSTLVRFELQQREAVAVASAVEAWILNQNITQMTPDEVDAFEQWAFSNQGGLEHHPGRQEAISYQAESRDGDVITAMQLIERQGKRSWLADKIQYFSGEELESKGRMANLFAPPEVEEATITLRALMALTQEGQ